MKTLYKAVRADGTDFHSGSLQYASTLGTKTPVRHPAPRRGSEDASHYISVSTEPGDCTGFSWPARLLAVVPVGKSWTPHPEELPNKRAVVALNVVDELQPHMLFGPQGEAVVEIVETFAKLSASSRSALYAARPTDWYDAYCAVAHGGRAVRAGLGAARSALFGRLRGWDWGGDGDAAYGAALAVLLRHTIGNKDCLTQAQYDTLTGVWLKATGQKAHPEDVVF